MKHVMSHDPPPETARKVAKRAFESYAERYPTWDPKIVWTSDTFANASFTAKGLSIQGTIELLPEAIAFELDVPFILRVFKKQAIGVMDRELRLWVDKAKAGELD